MDPQPPSRRPSKLPYVAALLLMGMVVVAAWLGRDRYTAIIAGSDAPTFSAMTLDGAPVSLADLDGKVVLLNVWATWCPPCRFEMPSMQRLHEAVDDEDFVVLAVSVDAAEPGEPDVFGRVAGDVPANIEENGYTFTVWHDPPGTIQRTYQTTGVPESFVIGRDGVIYKKVAGPTEWDSPEYEEMIRRLLDS
ncbi:MAG: TlpA family protein disulfide reductase [Gemmatimonadetes bacterium]|nr:TlpA family protein disulfide reductase [Gemmatimonadota bacterium]